MVDLKERWMRVHEASFCLGFHHPLHNFGLRFLQYSRLAPSQLHPNGWAKLVDFFVICYENNIDPTVDFLYCLFHLCLIKERYHMYTLQWTRQDNPFYESPPEEASFYSMWFLVKPPNDVWNALRKWRIDPERVAKP